MKRIKHPGKISNIKIIIVIRLVKCIFELLKPINFSECFQNFCALGASEVI